MTLQLHINGAFYESRSRQLLDVIAEQQLGDTPFAIAVNSVFVPKSAYESTELKNGDEVEILSPMQGG